MGWDGRGSQCWLVWAGVKMILTSFILGQGAGESNRHEGWIQLRVMDYCYLSDESNC